MAKKKSDDKAANFSVRCSEEVLTAVQDLARLSRTTVSELVAGICAELVRANFKRIANFRKQAATPIKLPTFNGDSAQASKKSTNAETKAAGDDNA